MRQTCVIYKIVQEDLERQLLEEFFNEHYSYQNLVEQNTDNLYVGKPEWIGKSSQEIDLLITERNRVNHSKRKYRRKRQRARLNKISRLKIKVMYMITYYLI